MVQRGDGLKVERHKDSAVLEIPTSDRGKLKFFTPLSGIKDFAAGKRDYIYFNPRRNNPIKGEDLDG